MPRLLQNHQLNYGQINQNDDTAARLICINSNQLQHELATKLFKQLLNRYSEDNWQPKALLNYCLRLTALYGYEPKILTGELSAKLVWHLVSRELSPGGPYGELDQPPDLATNAVVGKLLSQLGIQTKQLQQFLASQLDAEKLATNSLGPADTISNLVELLPNHADQLTDYLLQIADHYITGPLLTARTALGLIKLANAGAAKHLLQQLPRVKSVSEHSSLVDLTILQANQAYIIAQPGRKSFKISGSSLYSDLTAELETRLDQLAPNLYSASQEVYQLIKKADTNSEVMLISYFFAESLDLENKVSSKVLEQFAIANFYLWMAYTVYDDLLDDEGTPKYLPVANVAMRRSITTYQQAMKHQPDLWPVIDDLYTIMDKANAWELAHCRFAVTKDSIKIAKLPDYGDNMVLAERAMGHVIGPTLIVMMQSDLTQKQVDSLKLALAHYLIARQCNDDLHDWRKDLQAGHISPVVVNMLSGAKIDEGAHTFKQLVPILENYFWESGLERGCQLIHLHVGLARKHLQASKIVRRGGGFNKLLNTLEESAEKSLAIKKDQAQFLATYKTLRGA